MIMALSKGRPAKHGKPMKKTSINLPEIAIEALGEDAEKSGFNHWSEQLRFEIMYPRGLWKEPKRYLPAQDGPKVKA